jgi:hypothetical protein
MLTMRHRSEMPAASASASVLMNGKEGEEGCPSAMPNGSHVFDEAASGEWRGSQVASRRVPPFVLETACGVRSFITVYMS